MRPFVIRACQAFVAWVLIVIVSLLVADSLKIAASIALLAAVAGTMWIIFGGLRGRL